MTTVTMILAFPTSETHCFYCLYTFIYCLFLCLLNKCKLMIMIMMTLNIIANILMAACQYCLYQRHCLNHKSRSRKICPAGPAFKLWTKIYERRFRCGVPRRFRSRRYPAHRWSTVSCSWCPVSCWRASQANRTCGRRWLSTERPRRRRPARISHHLYVYLVQENKSDIIFYHQLSLLPPTGREMGNSLLATVLGNG